MKNIISVVVLGAVLMGCQSIEQIPPEPTPGPMVVWCHSGEQHDLDALRTVLQSPLITHVLINYRHIDDGNWHENEYVKVAIDIVKASNAKLIWGRSLWPWYAIENSTTEDLYDPCYYVKQIETVRAEAAEIGACMTAMDTEPYANSPIKKYVKGEDRVYLIPRQLSMIQEAVQKATDKVGKVDIVFPAGSMVTVHIYNALSALGNNRVSEHTYYDNSDAIKNIKYPYEMFGVQLSITKEHEGYPSLPFYLPAEIFERRELWSGTKGLFIYTSNRDSLAVAEALVAYGQGLTRGIGDS